jgi:hypothetical protein
MPYLARLPEYVADLVTNLHAIRRRMSPSKPVGVGFGCQLGSSADLTWGSSLVDGERGPGLGHGPPSGQAVAAIHHAKPCSPTRTIRHPELPTRGIIDGYEYSGLRCLRAG